MIMGLFDFVNSVAKVAVRTAILPVAVAKDVVTMGGALIDEPSATINNISKSVNDIENLPDKLEK
jgi:hypothetical protein